jgi:hypothetical protein
MLIRLLGQGSFKGMHDVEASNSDMVNVNSLPWIRALLFDKVILGHFLNWLGPCPALSFASRPGFRAEVLGISSDPFSSQ